MASKGEDTLGIELEEKRKSNRGLYRRDLHISQNQKPRFLLIPISTTSSIGIRTMICEAEREAPKRTGGKKEKNNQRSVDNRERESNQVLASKSKEFSAFQRKL